MLRQASRHRVIGFMAGNRDFLVGHELLADAGMTNLPDPTVLDAFGQRWLLAHGDAQCLADASYQAWRATSRSAAWQAGFLAKPLAERQAFGRQAREQSRASQAAQLMATDLDADACRATMREAVARARRGDGPQLVVAKLLRLAGHGTHDDAAYVTEDLKRRFGDALPQFEQTLIAQGVIDATGVAALWEEARTTIHTAVTQALAEPTPTAAEEDWNAFAARNLTEFRA